MDDIAVLPALAVLLLVVHLGIFSVLRTNGVRIVPTAHQVQSACAITEALGHK